MLDHLVYALLTLRRRWLVNLLLRCRCSYPSWTIPSTRSNISMHDRPFLQLLNPLMPLSLAHLFLWPLRLYQRTLYQTLSRILLPSSRNPRL